jgi:predicted phage terminase large subunit-like protein
MGDTTFPTFKALAQDFGVWGKVRLSPYPTAALLLDGGEAEVRFRTAEDPERMRGPNLSGAWLDEASLMTEDAFKIVIACLREGGQQGWLSATFTPKGWAHWTHEVFATGRPNTELFRARTGQNPFLPPDFARTLAEQYDDGFAAQELGGEFVDLEGAEWPVSYFRKEIWFDEWLPDSEYPVTVIGFDPNRGREVKAGDYAALVVARLDRQLTIWADAVMANTGDVHQHVGRGVALAREYRGSSMVVETNVGQELLVAEIERQQRQSGVMFPVMGYENKVPKTDRIRMRLGPYLARGRIRLRATKGGKLLGAQLQQFPNGEHDDGPDALELAVRRLEEIVNGVKR